MRFATRSVCGVVLSPLAAVAAGGRQVVLDGAVARELVYVQTGSAAGGLLVRVAETEWPEEVGAGAAQEGPEACRGILLVLEVGGIRECCGDRAAES